MGRSRDGDSVFGPSYPCGYQGCHKRYGMFMVPVRVPDAAPSGRSSSNGGQSRQSGPPRVTVSAVIVSRILDSRLARRCIGVVIVTAALLAACAYWLDGYLGWVGILGVALVSLVRVPRAPLVLALAFVLGVVTGLLFAVAVFMFGPPRWMRAMTSQTPLIDASPVDAHGAP